MLLKEKVASDWEKCKSQYPMPRSWYAYNINGHDVTLAESRVAECLATYIDLNPGQHLNDERIQHLIDCRALFVEARSHIDDEQAKSRLDFYLYMCIAVLIDCGV